MSQPSFDNPFDLIRELMLWADAIRDFFPDFETRMIKRERRFRLRHAEGKITDERLAIELNTIKDRRSAKGGN